MVESLVFIGAIWVFTIYTLIVPPKKELISNKNQSVPIELRTLEDPNRISDYNKCAAEGSLPLEECLKKFEGSNVYKH